MNLSSYYISIKRALEIIDQNDALARLQNVDKVSQIGGDGLRRMMLLDALEGALLRWLEAAKPPSLGELLTRGGVAVGSIFTHRSLFHCVGVNVAAGRFAEGKVLRGLPYIYSKLDAYQKGLRVRVEIHPSDLTTASAPGSLSGNKELFVLGRVIALEPTIVVAKAYTIGSIYYDYERDPADPALWPRWDRKMEIYVDEIDSFNRIRRHLFAPKEDIEALKQIPEVMIKHAFAEIIGENFVPKDWAGEQSDLLTSHLRLDGKRVRAAFIFKGPAKFKPLTPADVGKNGDQIYRAFNEPAELVVLQHCHQITGAVVETMRAFAGSMRYLKRFCVINGSDTARLMRAYGMFPRPGKLGKKAGSRYG